MYVVEDSEITFECGALDLVCKSMETQAQGLGTFMGWLAEIVLGSQDLAPGTKLWNTAIAEAGNWLGIAIVVMLAMGIIGLATGVLSLKSGEVGRSMLGIAAGLPSTYLALAVGGDLLSIADELSDAVLKRIGGQDGFQNIFRAVLQGGSGDDDAGVIINLFSGSQGIVPTILMLGFLIVGLVLIAFALAFRNLAIMILIAFSPLAFMATGMKGGWSIARKWALAGVALLISKPLMFGVLAMVLKSADGMALFSAETLTVVTGLFVVAFMPLMAYSFFSFLGSGNESQAGVNIGSTAGQKAGGVAKQGAGLVVQGGRAGAAGGAAGGGAHASQAGSSGSKSKNSGTGAPGASHGAGGQKKGGQNVQGNSNAGQSPSGASSGGQSSSKPSAPAMSQVPTGPSRPSALPHSRIPGPRRF
ncbi:MAG: hypothetical protein ACK5LO_13655 [Leucobacter sp.]